MADLECGSFFPFDEDQESCAEEELDLFGLIEFCPQRLGEACSPRGVLFSVVSEFQEIAHEVRGSGVVCASSLFSTTATVPEHISVTRWNTGVPSEERSREMALNR